LNDEVPERLDLILDKMLAKKPEVRYQTCAELIKDLDGLGLANPALSFLKEKEAPGPDKGSHSPYAPTAPMMPGARSGRPAARSLSSDTEVSGRDYWYLSYTQRDGKLVTRKLTTDQVSQLIKEDKHFDLEAQASRTRDGAYRSLATFKEFAPALSGRLAKARADRKGAKFQAAYAKLTKEAEDYEKRRWYRNLFRGAASWFMLLVWIAVILAVAYGAYWLIRFVLSPYLAAWWEKVTS
jgi:hypothetical protein